MTRSVAKKKDELQQSDIHTSGRERKKMEQRKKKERTNVAGNNSIQENNSLPLTSLSLSSIECTDDDAADQKETVIVIIGGGISGICCAQELTRLTQTSTIKKIRILVISATDTLKETKSVIKITNHLEEISVYERKSDYFQGLYPNIEIIHDLVLFLHPTEKLLYLQSGKLLHYDKVCICSGASPLLLAKHPNIIGIRDVESVQELANRLQTARKVAIVGNGGISLELVHELRFCDISWIIRDNYLGNTFFDATASAFILPTLLEQHVRHSQVSSLPHTNSLSINSSSSSTNQNNQSNEHLMVCGVALGPEWIEKTKLKEKIQSPEVLSRIGKLEVEYGQEVCGILSSLSDLKWQRIRNGHSCHDFIDNSYTIPDWKEPISSNESYPLYLHTTENKIIGCDFIISATGVVPCTSFLHPTQEFLQNYLNINEIQQKIQIETTTGAIYINECFETTCHDIYAAGDCCVVYLSDQSHETTDLEPSPSPPSPSSSSSSSVKYHRHWFQMRLWSQARAMGIGAAHSIFNSLENDFKMNINSIEMKVETLEEFQQRADNIWGGVMFNIFAHVTHFFDYKVVLLGRYNGQGLGANVEKYIKEMVVTPEGLIKEKYRNSVAQGRVNPSSSSSSSNTATATTTTLTQLEDEKEEKNETILDLFYQQSVTALDQPHIQNNLEIWTRITPQEEYVKLVVYYGKIIGALLIGDTDLEEVCENLILNEIDVRRYGMELLDPDIDIEDYFD